MDALKKAKNACVAANRPHHYHRVCVCVFLTHLAQVEPKATRNDPQNL